jgi:hypothetical protein
MAFDQAFRQTHATILPSAGGTIPASAAFVQRVPR